MKDSTIEDKKLYNKQYYQKNKVRLIEYANKYSKEHYVYEPKIRSWNGKSYKVLNGIRAHRLVFETRYKCCLLSWAHIHHINRNRHDNRIENLQGMTNKQHMKFHCHDYYGGGG